MFFRTATQTARNFTISGESDPNRIRSSACSGRRENFRIVMVGPTSDSGGMIALTREPSGSRASTIGELSSIRRPRGETILSIAASTWLESANAVSVR